MRAGGARLPQPRTCSPSSPNRASAEFFGRFRARHERFCVRAMGHQPTWLTARTRGANRLHRYV